MTSLRDKLRASQPQAKRPAPQKAAPSDCYVRETRFPVPRAFLALPEGILPLMQGDESLPRSVLPGELLFLDTETTGLSGGAGTIAFLIGTGRFEGDAFVVRQYLMRDYDEEGFLLRRVAHDLANCRALITFNGRTFDMPLIASRFIMQRMRVDCDAIPHADLLHTARRVWKMRLRGCSLSALENRIYNEPRVDDLPGALVPQRYFDYLKTKDFSLLEDVLRHNALDIYSLSRLLYTLSDLHADPLSAHFEQDIFSLGRVMEKRGRMQDARMCYRALDQGSLSALSRNRLADSLRRERGYGEAAAIYERMIACHQGGAAPYVALAKLCEHRLGDIPRALMLSQTALSLLADGSPGGSYDAQMIEAIAHRCDRLMKKLQNMRGG